MTPARIARTAGFVLILLTASVAAAQEAATPPATPARPDAQPQRRRSNPDEWKWVHDVPVRLAKHEILFSKSMSRDVGYFIYLPPEYETHPNRRYPVVYFLHGANSDEEGGAHLGKVMQHEMDEGRVGPVIWVFVNGGPVSGWRDWPDSYVKAETLVIDELIPWIEGRYRVRTDREGRAICGYSMGGNGAMRFATKYPEKFCAVATIAGAFGNDSNRGGDDNVFRWTREHADQLRGRTPIWMFVGAKDRLKPAQTKFIALLDELDFGYRYRVIEGKGHQIGEMWNEVCPEFVRSIAGACAPPAE